MKGVTWNKFMEFNLDHKYKWYMCSPQNDL